MVIHLRLVGKNIQLYPYVPLPLVLQFPPFGRVSTILVIIHDIGKAPTWYYHGGFQGRGGGGDVGIGGQYW